MAKVAQIQSPAPALSSVSSARLTGARGGSGGAGPVEGANPSNPAGYENGAYGFHQGLEYGFADREGFGSGNGNQGRQDLNRGKFRAPTEVFARIFEELRAGTTIDPTAQDTKRRGVFKVPVAEAISTYELNSSVIHGTLPKLGLALSMRL